jgi:hypothetical protein
LLQEIKAAIQDLDPQLDRKSREFRLPVILMAAAFVVGPDIDRLASFTGYSRTFVAAVSHRMQACGRWANGNVCTDDWFDGDRVTAALWLDCLVADGTVEMGQTDDGEKWCRRVALP